MASSGSTRVSTGFAAGQHAQHLRFEVAQIGCAFAHALVRERRELGADAARGVAPGAGGAVSRTQRFGGKTRERGIVEQREVRFRDLAARTRERLRHAAARGIERSAFARFAAAGFVDLRLGCVEENGAPDGQAGNGRDAFEERRRGDGGARRCVAIRGKQSGQGRECAFRFAAARADFEAIAELDAEAHHRDRAARVGVAAVGVQGHDGVDAAQCGDDLRGGARVQTVVEGDAEMPRGER